MIYHSVIVFSYVAEMGLGTLTNKLLSYLLSDRSQNNTAVLPCQLCTVTQSCGSSSLEGVCDLSV